jgi:hypothetical protein
MGKGNPYRKLVVFSPSCGALEKSDGEDGGGVLGSKQKE